MPQKNKVNPQLRIALLSRCHFVTLSLFFMLLFSCAHQGGAPEIGTANTVGITGEAKILKSWHGDYPVVDIDRLPGESEHQGIGYITDEKTFEDVWAVFKPGEKTTAVDFKSDLVFFVHNVRYFNRIVIGKVMLKKGIVEIVARETLSARPIEDVVAMSMVMVPKRGVAGIQDRGAVIPVTE